MLLSCGRIDVRGGLESIAYHLHTSKPSDVSISTVQKTSPAIEVILLMF